MDPAKKTVLILSLVVFFVMLGIAMITPDIAQYGKALGDLFGNSRMMKYGLAIIVVSSLGAFVAFSYWMLLAVRFLEGVGSAFYVTSSLAALAKAAPAEKRGRDMGIYVNRLLPGQIFAPVVGGAVTVYGGLAAPFAAYAVCAAAGLVLVAALLRLPAGGGGPRV